MSAPATLKQTRKLLDLFGDNPSTEQVQNLLANGDLVKTMLDRDLNYVDRRQFNLVMASAGKSSNSNQNRGLFTSLEVQLANVHNWNQMQDWGFTDADFDSIDLTPASHSGLVVDVIAVYLPDQGKMSGIQRTFEYLWAIASSASLQPGHWRYRSLKSDPKHLRLLDGIEHVPGIRRVTLDLGAHWATTNGIRPMDVRGNASTHAEVLAAAAHFPDWVQAMDGERVPYVWMPGYQVTIPGSEAWRSLPNLHWSSGDRRVELYANWDDIRYHRWACPVVVRRES